MTRPPPADVGTYAYYGLSKCCNRTLSIKRPCCCCGLEDEPGYRGWCTQCEKIEPLAGRPALAPARPEQWLDKPMCNGALLGFSAGWPEAVRYLDDWAACALDERCIAPHYGVPMHGRGSVSTRGNHRQDQAALSILSYQHGFGCQTKVHELGFQLHTDGTNDNQLCRTIVGRAVAEHDRVPA